MNKYLLAVICPILSFPSIAVLHPVLVDPVISKCTGGIEGPCSAQVYYTASGTQLVDIPEIGKPDPTKGTELAAVGIHCDRGSQITGKPFSVCNFFHGAPSHTPEITNCHLKDTTSWELTTTSTCSLTRSTWGQHTGAGPGGECIIFIQKSSGFAPNYPTIHGLLNATTAANSGNRFCQKAVPPTVPCDITLPGDIDHGVIGPNANSKISIDGLLNCGTDPKVAVLGGDRLQLATGVYSHVTVRTSGANAIRVTSDLTARGGAIGVHAASVVVIVSPY